jgi:hypothetical protein
VGHQIIQQPDGKLAVFSSFTDTWILMDASPEDLLDYYAGKAAKDAREQTQQVLDAVLAGKPREAYYQFAMTFATANAKSKFHGGEVLPGPVDEELLAELTSWKEEDDQAEQAGD